MHLYEFFYFHLQKNEDTVFELPLQAKLKAPLKDTHTSFFLSTKGEFEPVQTKLLISLLQLDSIVLDIGANFGYYSVITAKKCDRGMVYAFEPDNRNFNYLKANFELNKLQNMQVFPLALGDKTGKVKFSQGKRHMGSSHISTSSEFDYQVDMMTLDTFATQNNINLVNVILIDVEGFELLILKNATELISRSPNLYVFIEYNPITLEEFSFNSSDFFSTMESLNLQPIKIINEQKGALLDYSSESLQEVMKNSTYTNLLFKKKT